MDVRNNLLVRLHKWAARQDENFLTDAFAHLVQYLLEEEPSAAIALLEALTGGFLQLRPDEAKMVAVRTQIVTGDGTPDLEIRTPRHLVYVEVKSESIANSRQIEKYRRLLTASGVSATCLVLLSRYPVVFAEGSAIPDFYARWYQVADWMEQQRGRYTFKAVSSYLVEQFLGFLGMRNMTMAQVTWELAGGVRALRTFIDMLYEAAISCAAKCKVITGRDESGVYVDGTNYWVSINYDNPDLLLFQTWDRPVDKEAAAALGIGEVHEWKDKTGYGWSRNLDLQAEDVHFYARSRASQMQLLEEFIRESINIAKQVEVAEKAVRTDDVSTDAGIM